MLLEYWIHDIFSIWDPFGYAVQESMFDSSFSILNSLFSILYLLPSIFHPHPQQLQPMSLEACQLKAFFHGILLRRFLDRFSSPLSP